MEDKEAMDVERVAAALQKEYARQQKAVKFFNFKDMAKVAIEANPAPNVALSEDEAVEIMCRANLEACFSGELSTDGANSVEDELRCAYRALAPYLTQGKQVEALVSAARNIADAYLDANGEWTGIDNLSSINKTKGMCAIESLPELLAPFAAPQDTGASNNG